MSLGASKDAPLLGMTVENVDLQVTTSTVDLGPSISYVDAGASVEHALLGLSCTCVDLQGEIHWVAMEATDVRLDASGNLKFIKDGHEFDITEDISLNIGKMFYDTVSTAESTVWDLGKGLTNPVSLSEAIEFLITFIRSLADSTSIAETLSKLFSRPVADSVALTESLEYTFDFNLYPTDTTTLNEDLSYVFAKGLSDTVATAESTAFDISKPLSETATMSENATIQVGTFFLDTLTLSDTIEYIVFVESTAVVNGGAVNTFAING